MGFRAWFKLWIAAFLRLLSFDRKKHKSEEQIKKERERRLKAIYSNNTLYCRKKQRRKRRSGMVVQNEKLAMRMVDFFAVTFGILFLPFGLFHWGYKNVRLKKREKAVKRAKSVKHPTQATHAQSVMPHKQVFHNQAVTHRQNIFATQAPHTVQQSYIVPPAHKKLTLEEMKQHKLSVVKEGEKDVNAVVQDDNKPLGRIWLDNLERFFAEYSVLLQAGKTQMDAVSNVAVSKGRITADVSGEKKVPYKVIVTIEPMAQPCNDEITIRDFFPTKKDFWLFCTCGEEVCAHVFAVLYAVGNVFKNDEGLFYRLRGSERLKQ